MSYKDIMAILPGTKGEVEIKGKRYIIDKTTTKTKVSPVESNNDKK